MSDILENLIIDAQSANMDAATEALTQLRLMVERFSLNRQNHPVYARMYDELLGKNAQRLLSAEEFGQVLDLLTRILRSGEPLSVYAAWALGKTADLEVSVEIIRCLQEWRTNTDEFNNALLSALQDEHGFPYGGKIRWGVVIDWVKQLQTDGGSQTKTLASNIIRLYPSQFIDAHYQLDNE